MLSRADLQSQLEETDRRLGRESLFYFAKFCLGYGLMQPTPHREVCKFAEDVARTHKRGLVLEPRGCFKTTQFSQALPVWLVLNNPNVRILLDSTVLQNSIDNLGVCKRHFESPEFQYLFGDFVGDHWVAEEITCRTRIRKDLKEPTIRCASPERTQVGPHYDVIIADDLVSKENVETPEQRAKIKDHFKLLFSLLEPDGILIVVGTRWHYDDCYGMIAEHYPEFQRRIKSAETSGHDGGLYFPERLTTKFLEEQKRNLGREFFNSQYLNDPAPEDADAKFQKAWFKRYAQLPKNSYGFITIDPGGEAKGNDEWVMIGAYCDDRNEIYFDKLLKGNWRIERAWEMLFKLLDHVDPIAVGLETTGGQRYLLEGLQDEMRRRNRFFHVVPLTHAQHSKEYRIERLIPRYEIGAIHHSSEMEPLEDQLRRYPKAKDDIADAAAMVLEISVAPRRKTAKEPPIRSMDDMIWHKVMTGQEKTVGHRVLGDQW